MTDRSGFCKTLAAGVRVLQFSQTFFSSRKRYSYPYAGEADIRVFYLYFFFSFVHCTVRELYSPQSVSGQSGIKQNGDDDGC